MPKKVACLIEGPNPDLSTALVGKELVMFRSVADLVEALRKGEAFDCFVLGLYVEWVTPTEDWEARAAAVGGMATITPYGAELLSRLQEFGIDSRRVIVLTTDWPIVWSALGERRPNVHVLDYLEDSWRKLIPQLVDECASAAC